MDFPARFKKYGPEGYPDLSFQIQVNPTTTELAALARMGYVAQTAPADATAEERKAIEAQNAKARTEYGAALVKAYAGATVGAYGAVFDFSTAEAAIVTLENETMPDDLRYWLKSAPADVAIMERDLITKNYRAS